MTSFQPLSDQILVKVIPFEDRIKSIWVPETVDHGRLPIRQGIVVALGCGDVVAPKCYNCAGLGKWPGNDALDHTCRKCNGTGFGPHERTTFTVKVGDKILFHPRPWAEKMLDGELHVVIHEDQHVLGIIEGDE